jgi:hypothetical protein
MVEGKSIGGAFATRPLQPAHPDRLRLWVFAGLVAGLLTLPTVLWATDSTTSFSGQIVIPTNIPSTCWGVCRDPPSPIHPSAVLPPGKNVVFQWVDTSVGFVSFAVRSGGLQGPEVGGCTWLDSTHGSCTFASTGENYSFLASNSLGTSQGSQVVDYSGSYLDAII